MYFPNSVARLGVLTVEVNERTAVHSRCSHPCRFTNARRARFLSCVHFMWQAWHFLHVAKTY